MTCRGFARCAFLVALPGLIPVHTLTCQSAAHRFQVINEAGVPTAVNHGGPRFDGDLFSYEHVLTLQQDPNLEASLITRAAGFTMAENGEYVVADCRPVAGGASVARLVVFGPDGRFLREMGRVGSGPGEFLYMDLQDVNDTTIEVYDINLRQTTLFSISGELLDVVTAPATFAQRFNQLWPISDGRMVAISVHNSNTEYVYTEFWVVGPQGTVVSHHRSPDVKSSILMDLGAGQMGPYQYPYPPMPAAIYVPGEGIAVSGGVEPVIDVFGLDGAVGRRVRVEDLPLNITATDKDRFESYWTGRIARFPEEAKAILSQNRDDLRRAMPDSKPPWTFISVDDRGYWWLRVQDVPDVWISGVQTYTYRLLSPEGEYLGTTQAPPTNYRSTSAPLFFGCKVRNGNMLTIEMDPNTGEELLKVYRMTPAVDGFVYR